MNQTRTWHFGFLLNILEKEGNSKRQQGGDKREERQLRREENKQIGSH